LRRELSSTILSLLERGITRPRSGRQLYICYLGKRWDVSSATCMGTSHGRVSVGRNRSPSLPRGGMSTSNIGTSTTTAYVPVWGLHSARLRKEAVAERAGRGGRLYISTSTVRRVRHKSSLAPLARAASHHQTHLQQSQVCWYTVRRWNICPKKERMTSAAGRTDYRMLVL
jgi:hypothetical protein